MSAFHPAVSARLLVLVAGILTGACQSVPGQQQAAERPPAMQTITIATPGADGAQCSLKSVAVGQVNITTPGQVEVDRSPEIIVVRCRKACFLDASAMISSEGQRLSDGTVIYNYPRTTEVAMRPTDCNPPAGGTGRPAASPL